MAAVTEDAAITAPAGVAYSVVIVNWNVRDLLRACLVSVRAEQRRARQAVEIVVVDNASTDGSVAMVRDEFPDVHLVASPENLGFGRANNLALQHCHAPVIVLLNPDTIVREGAIDALVDYLDAHPRVAIAGCRLLNGDGSFQRWTGGSFPTVTRVALWATGAGRALPGMPVSSLFLDRDVAEDIEVDWISGACMAVRASAAGAQLFDPRYFMYGEDMELCARMHADGWSVRYVPQVSITHFHGRSMAQQSEAVMLSALKGPRSFYIARNGRRWLWAYDLVLVLGFAFRAAGFAVLSAVRGAPAAVKARTNRDLARRALHVMRGR